MANSTATGQIEYVGPVESVGRNHTAKRTIILMVTEGDQGQWVNHFQIDFLGERASKFPGQVGQRAEITFEVKGRKYEKDGKTMYFTSLNGYRWEIYQTVDSSQPPANTGYRSGIIHPPPGNAPQLDGFHPDMDDSTRQRRFTTPEPRHNDDDIPW